MWISPATIKVKKAQSNTTIFIDLRTELNNPSVIQTFKILEKNNNT